MTACPKCHGEVESVTGRVGETHGWCKTCQESRLLPCPHCGRRTHHSCSGMYLCGVYHEWLAVMKEYKTYLPRGTNLYPWKEEIPPNVARNLWVYYLRDAIAVRDGLKCQKCGEVLGGWQKNRIHPWLASEAEVHHILPRERGGKDHPANLKLLCGRCHARIEDHHQKHEEQRPRKHQLEEWN